MSEQQPTRADEPVIEGALAGGPETVAEPRDRHGRNGKGRPSSPHDLVDEPPKVMGIGTMVRQLLEEVRSAPLDDGAAPPGGDPRAFHPGTRRRAGPRADRGTAPDRPALPS